VSQSFHFTTEQAAQRQHTEVDMKARHIILTIAAAIVLAAPTTVLAQAGPGPGDGNGPGGAWGADQGPHGGGHGRFGDPEGGDGLRFFERMLPRLAEELGLSDEQLSEIQTIVDEARPKIEEYANQLREGRDTYRAANEDPTYFNPEAFRAHAEAQHAIQTKLGVVAGQAKADAFKVLTPEQLEQLEEMRGNFGKGKSRRGSGRRSSS
jgi:Spy/CpxP family protein refolding chaperone